MKKMKTARVYLSVEKAGTGVRKRKAGAVVRLKS